MPVLHPELGVAVEDVRDAVDDQVHRVGAGEHGAGRAGDLVGIGQGPGAVVCLGHAPP